MVKGHFSAREHVRSQGEKPMLVGREREPDPSGLALILLIDRTGSMGNEQIAGDVPGAGFYSPSGRMYHARRAAMLLSLTCAGARIPLGIRLRRQRGLVAPWPARGPDAASAAVGGLDP